MSQQLTMLCQLHQEEVIAIDELEQDLNIRKLCLKCLAKGYKRKVTLVKESIHQIKEIKAMIKQDRQNQLQNNLESFECFINSIEQLKDYYIKQIESILSIVQKWMQQCQSIEEEFINKVQSKEENDIQSFLNFIKQQQELQLKEQPQFQQNIQQLLINLRETKVMQKCNETLENIHPISNVLENAITQENEKNQCVQLNLYCEDHQQKRISLFDLGQEKISQRRLACKNCLDNYPSSNYKTINYAYSLWNDILKKRQGNMQRNLELICEKVESIKKYLLLIQNDINKQFEKSLLQLTTSYKQYESQVNQIVSKINLPWYKLSKEELLTIVEELSQINQLTIFDDPLQQEYLAQDNLTNKTVQAIPQFLKECQISYWDKLNPLIKSQISIDTNCELRISQSNCDQFQMEKQETGLKTMTKQATQQIMDQDTIVEQDILYYGFEQQFPADELIENSSIKENEQFTYELIGNSSIKEDKQWCRVMAFNKDSSILAVGCTTQIKVFEFKEGIINLIQIMSQHQNKVFVLKFMKNSSHLISGSGSDGLIIIWSMKQKNEWVCQEKLSTNSGIHSLVLSKNEDMMVSGSKDGKITFWSNNNKWVWQQTIVESKKCINALSLNNEQNKLISCGDDQKILIIACSKQDQKWFVQERININNVGLRLCFINDQLFTFQERENEKLHIYECNQSNNGQYFKTKDIQIKCSQSDGYCLFPQQYIQNKEFIVSKSGQYINIIKIMKNGDFITKQSIEFQSDGLFGCMSEDGEYLVTWDEISKEIQVRKYQLL